MRDRTPPEIVLQRQGQPIIHLTFLFRLIVGLVAVLLVALFAIDSYFVVEPTEMAGVTLVLSEEFGPGDIPSNPRAA
jgi:hypothetical protein